MTKNLYLFFFFLPVLLSCGGGGSNGPAGGSPSPIAFSGVAIDGALYKATAFLDLNGNGQLDAGEPFSTTNANGSYTLNATQDQINSHSVVVLSTAGTTIDQDTPGSPMTTNMTMIAPAGNPTVVSPLTTQVAAKMASGVSLSAAKSAVQAELGLNSLDVMKNYVQEKATNPAYADAHKIAASVAEVLKSVDSSSNSNTSLADKLVSIAGKVSTQVAPSAAQIKASATVNDAKLILVSVINNFEAAKTFNLSGTISGLRSNGLLLSSGTENISPLANSNSFRFENKFANKDVYEVKIKAQPIGQTCSLTNGSGSFNSQSVTNVAITCLDSPGILSGSVSGLTNSGLVLKNGSEQIAVPTGATDFTFQNKVNAGASYAVTVEANPTGKTCTVAKGTGTMVSAGKSDLQVTCSVNSYSVAGSISGLLADGLKLSNNGLEVKSVSSGSTVFGFDNNIAYGGGYSIAVDTQPNGYTCSVSNGTGTMGAANITSVQVTCSVNSYSVSGIISGLSVDGLKLSNNGLEVKSISSGSTAFGFEDNVAFGGGYSVAVDTQPIGYTCSVSNGVGTMGSSSITNVQVACSVNSYTVSGSITGLSATGLVLSNGHELLSIPIGGTNFIFSNKVLHDNSYSLSIVSQPVNQTCYLSNAFASNVSSNISSVVVNCSNNTYNLSIALSGLNNFSNLAVSGNINYVGFSYSLNTDTSDYLIGTGLLMNTPYAFQIGYASSGQSCALNSGGSSTNGLIQGNVKLGITCQPLAPVVPACTTSYGSVNQFIRIKTVCCNGYCTVQSY
jgi:hypothetical protein